jgi:signal transduction histidine kinase
LNDHEVLELFRKVHPDNLPLHIYLVGLDGRFLIAGRGIRQLFGLPLDGPLQHKIGDFYADPARREQLLQKAHQAAQDGHYLEREMVIFNTPGGRVHMEMFCRPLVDPASAEIVAYFGWLVDRTHEVEGERTNQALTEKINELISDIGRVLHAHSSTLTMTSLALNPVIDLLAYEQELPPEKSELSPEREATILDGAAHKLSHAIQALLNAVSPEMRQTLAAHRWEYLERTCEDINDPGLVPFPEARPSMLRNYAATVVRICDEIKSERVPREAVREVKRTALQMQRVCAYIPTLRAYVAVRQMEHGLQALRDYITSDLRSHEANTAIAIRTLIDHTVAGLSEFARSRGIEVVVKDSSRGAELLGQERELQRAFSNLLHNAIKYTWGRPAGKSPWVTIEIRPTEKSLVISFENWGVPIKQQEITTGKIFELGYRGELSRDRNRLGTGIGLTDVKQVVTAHHGTVTVECRPARPTNLSEEDSKYYDQPFITVFTVVLPLKR